MRLQMLGGVICATLTVPATGPLHAQTGSTRSFEVASVRLSSPTTRVSHRITDTRVDLIKIDLRQLLWMAFEIDPFCCRDRIPGAEPLGGVLVDIQATMPAGAARKQVPELMRSLLIQRFGLRTHVETRTVDGYELVVGKDGIRMKEVEAANDLDKVFPPDPSVRTLSDSEGIVNGRTRTIVSVRGITTITERSMYARSNRQITAVRMAMSDLAALLAQNTGRPVRDRTNLTGVYTFSIELPPDAWLERISASAGITTNAAGAPLNEPTGLSAVKAVEQLGLKLESRRMPVDTIIVDQIQRTPTDN